MATGFGTAPLLANAAATAVDITPPPGIHLHNWSYSELTTATGVHRPLAATMIALEVDGSRCLLVSLDLGWWMDRRDEERLRGALARSTGLAPEQFIVALTHTHSGPSIAREDADRPGGELVGPYLDRLEADLSSSAVALFASLRPAILEWATGSCTLAVNRDLYLPEEDRHVVGTNVHGATDSTLVVGRLCARDDGEILAVVANYAVHPISLGGDNALISPDLVGSARQLVADHAGAPLLFLQGASGDLAPLRHYAADPAVADENGLVLGHAVLSVLHGMLPPGTGLTYAGTIESGAPLGTFRSVPLDPDRRVRMSTLRLTFPTKDNQPQAGGGERVQADRAIRAVRIRRNAPDATIDFPVTVWELADTTVFAYPGEAYCELQVRLRREFPGHPLLFVNLANGPHCGYIAPGQAHEDGRYPAWQSPLDGACFGILLDACRKYLDDQRAASDSGGP